MILAAIVVGLLTAYYLGLRAGAYAAAATGAAFLVAALLPPLAVVAYLAVAAGIIALFVIGPRHGPSPASRAALSQVRRLLRRFWR